MKQYYAVITQWKGEIWFERDGDEGHLLKEGYARRLYGELDSDATTKIILVRITLNADATISTETLETKGGAK
jgi:hypothetical protein